MEEVIVTGKLEEQDFIKANFNFFWGKWQNKLLLLVCFVIVFLGGWLVIMTGIRDVTMNHFYFLVPVLIPVILPLTIWFQSKKTYANLQEFQRNYRYVFTTTGYQVQDEKSSSQMTWESIQKVEETKEAFHLFFRKNLFSIVPKKHIEDSEDLLRLRKIIRQALGPKAYLSQ